MTSFFSQTPNLLAPKVEIVVDNDNVVDMVGGVNTGTCYSLTGHLVISVPALPLALQERTRQVRNLSVSIEGKAEYYDEEFRYTPLRLYSSTLNLASPGKPLLLPHTPAEPGTRVQYAVAFDLRLPGWLPPTHISSMTNTSYGLVANILVGWADSPPLDPPSFTESVTGLSLASERITFKDALFSEPLPSHSQSGSGSMSIPTPPKIQTYKPFQKAHHKARATKALFHHPSLQMTATEKHSTKRHEFIVRRHKIPVRVDGTQQVRALGCSERTFSLKPVGQSQSPVECIVTIPDWIDVNGDDRGLKVTLRMRARRSDSGVDVMAPAGEVVGGEDMEGGEEIGGETRDLDGDVSMSEVVEREKDVDGEEILTRIIELGMEVEERESFSSNAFPSFTQAFPLPLDQPSAGTSTFPLLHPSPQADLWHLGAFTHSDPVETKLNRPCLLADDGNQRNFFFDGDGLTLTEDKFRKVNVCLPMSGDRVTGQGLSAGVAGNDRERERLKGGRPQFEMDGPFLKIRHVLKIRVVCQTGDLSDPQQTVVVLSTPIRFGSCPATCPLEPRKTVRPSSRSTIYSRPCPRLPAYVQLFYENGEVRECDPLPLYSSVVSSKMKSIPELPAPAYKARSQSISFLQNPSTSSSPMSRTRFAARPSVGPASFDQNRHHLLEDQSGIHQSEEDLGEASSSSTSSSGSSRSASPTSSEGDLMDLDEARRNLIDQVTVKVTTAQVLGVGHGPAQSEQIV